MLGEGHVDEHIVLGLVFPAQQACGTAREAIGDGAPSAWPRPSDRSSYTTTRDANLDWPSPKGPFHDELAGVGRLDSVGQAECPSSRQFPLAGAFHLSTNRSTTVY